jgi:hypothetical protein
LLCRRFSAFAFFWHCSRNRRAQCGRYPHYSPLSVAAPFGHPNTKAGLFYGHT